VAPESETKRRKTFMTTKVTDVEFHIRCSSGAEAIYREEVYVDVANRVVKYNLAFIHFGVFQKDHGRVVGYDNAHGDHERHFMGNVEKVTFTSYKDTLERFSAEVKHYREMA
jgi:hypothetical protein